MPVLSLRIAAYMCILEPINSMAEDSSLLSLDALEERMLRIVALSTYEERRLCVRDMLAMSDLGSRSTIHVRLHSMQRKGWIVLVGTEGRRRKHIALTEETLLVLDALGNRILRAAVFLQKRHNL